MSPRLDVAIDPVSRAIIRGSLAIEPDGAVEIRLPFRLESPNKTLWAHWRVKQRAKHAWMARLKLVIGDAARVTTLTSYRHPLQALGLEPVRERRRVRFERLVPSARNFIRDRDNLVFAGKPLLDCIKQLGLLRDDSSAWTDLQEPVQRVSDDGRDWTVIRIEVPAGVSIPLRADPAARKSE